MTTQIYTCPLCDWREESETSRYAESNAAAAPAIAAVMGLPTNALLEIYTRQALYRDERMLERHLASHELVEWVQALMTARLRITELESELGALQ